MTDSRVTPQLEAAWRLSIQACTDAGGAPLGSFNWPWALGLALDQIELSGETNQKITELSAWINSTYPADLDPEARVWRRIGKLTEENGEVTEAWLGVIGENARKGQHGCVDDVIRELLDVAACALGAIEHFNGYSGDAMEQLAEHVAYVHERAGLLAVSE